MKNVKLKNKVVSILSALVIGVTTLLPTAQVYGATNDGVGEAYLYKMENVDPKTGCGDYLVVAKLKEGWKPYTRVSLSTYDFTFCDAYDNGYTMGDSTNRYVWKNTKGCVLEDMDNGGYMIMGKVTNPTNGLIEIPVRICPEHRPDTVPNMNPSFAITIAENGAAGVQVDQLLYFRKAIPISEKGNMQGGNSIQQDAKEYVKFTLNEGTYYLGNIGGMLGSDRLKSMQIGEAPYMSSGRTMVPVKYAAEALSCNIEWNAVKSEVVVKASNNTYRLSLNSQYAYDAAGKKYDLGAKTTQKNGRTYVAVGALGQLLNCGVAWDSKTQTATFTKK